MTSPAFNAFATSLALALPATPPRRTLTSRGGSSVPGTPRSTRITVTASPATVSPALDSSPWTASTPPTSLRILRFVHNLTPSPRSCSKGSPLARGCHSPRAPVNIVKSRSSALARLSPTMAQKQQPRAARGANMPQDDDEDRMEVDSASQKLRPGDAGIRRKLFASVRSPRAAPRKSMPATLNDDDDWLPLASARRGVSMLPTRSAESLLLDPTQRGVKRKRA